MISSRLAVSQLGWASTCTSPGLSDEHSKGFHLPFVVNFSQTDATHFNGAAERDGCQARLLLRSIRFGGKYYVAVLQDQRGSDALPDRPLARFPA